MDINDQAKVQEVPVEVVNQSKPKRFKKRQISVKRTNKALRYKEVTFLAGDIQTAARRLGVAYSTIWSSAQRHGWLSGYKSLQSKNLKNKLQRVTEETLSPEMAKAWQVNQVHRSIKHSEKLDRVFEQVEDPSALNQVQKALDSVDVRARKALGLDKNEGTQVNNLVQVNLHSS